ncbi:MAG: GAF domain-containing protein [Symplocastrum torsivum CPER-KK1]|uniref:histidine kinase n=1 Tax=Symplocastrum torsivum CPER-KK1 TaxID=450513 RepID=A0A951PMP0_9CYAN|nr:GAF domain-containing protein [Symplocastrum torsivum CPER-KK1]
MVDITFAKQAETELHRRLCQQSAITQLTQSALLATDVSALLDESVALISQALAVEYCNVLEGLPDSNNLRMRSGIGWSPGLVGQAVIEASPNTQVGYTLHLNQAVVVENLHRETRFQGSPLLHEHDIVSGISAIIPAGQNPESDEGRSPTPPNRPFGVLGAYTSRRRVFSQGDVEFLQAVANVLAISIENQRTHDSLDKVKTQLAQATVALEKRTQELDQFAYIASHDLKAPLRAIANLSEWIEEDIFDQLNEDNQYQMQLLRGRVHRLEALIDGMQHYCRAGRITGTPERVDVEALLKQVIETLTPPPEFIIEVAPGMPTLVTMRSLLEQVFTQLIDNAIKHHPKADGQVKISVQEQLEAYEFAVTDNGEGIAPQFHEQVFVIFQTLQARDEVENTGVGLAIAKRIVEGQGGTIRLESQEGQGATFYFTWPKSNGTDIRALK